MNVTTSQHCFMNVTTSQHCFMNVTTSQHCFMTVTRHHTNPVGTEWKWKMDEPEIIVKGALESHYKMIKQFRGMNSK